VKRARGSRALWRIGVRRWLSGRPGAMELMPPAQCCIRGARFPGSYQRFVFLRGHVTDPVERVALSPRGPSDPWARAALPERRRWMVDDSTGLFSFSLDLAAELRDLGAPANPNPARRQVTPLIVPAVGAGRGPVLTEEPAWMARPGQLLQLPTASAGCP